MASESAAKRTKNRIRHKSFEEQFGLKEDCGCRYAIYILGMLSKRCTKMQKDCHMCFIDNEKAFNNVQHNEHSSA